MPNQELLKIEVKIPAGQLVIRHAACSNGHSLLSDELKFGENPAIRIGIEKGGKEGLLYLDPLYGSYRKEIRGLEVADGETVAFYCPECRESLLEEGETCRLCAAPLFVLNLPGGGVVEGCSRKGCLFHNLKIVDQNEQLARLFRDDTLASFL